MRIIILFCSLAGASCLAISAESKIDSSKSAFHVNETVTLCGLIKQVTNTKKVTYLNFGAKYPNQHISVAIWKKQRSKFLAKFGSLKVFENKNACARGKITKYKNNLQLKIKKPQFLSLVVAKEQKSLLVKSTKIKERAYLSLENRGILIMEEEFDRSWRHVGLALEIIGFTIQERNRLAGVYFVRYVDPENKINVESGAWDKFLPWVEDIKDKNKPIEYSVQITGTVSGSEVKVVNEDGSLQRSDIADRILNLLYEQLR